MKSLHVACMLLLLPLAGCAGSTSQTKDGEKASTDKKVIGDFSLKDIKGQTVRLKDLKDKVVLISFFATWCEPCKHELPMLQEIWQKYQEKGFALVGIAVDPPDLESGVREMVHRYQYKFPVLLDQETEVVNRFNPTMDLPFSLLVDRSGRIAAVHQGYKTGDEVTIEKEIQDLLSR